MRRAFGDAAGLTIKAQVRQAARNLGYPAEDWRVREAWYGRARAWSAAALDELRAQSSVWRADEAGQGDAEALVRRVREVRAGLTRLDRELADVEAEVVRIGAEVSGT